MSLTAMELLHTFLLFCYYKAALLRYKTLSLNNAFDTTPVIYAMQGFWALVAAQKSLLLTLAQGLTYAALMQV